MILIGPKRPYKHEDLTSHDFWYPPYIGPWNHNVRSLCLCGHFGPLSHTVTAEGHGLTSDLALRVLSRCSKRVLCEVYSTGFPGNDNQVNLPKQPRASKSPRLRKIPEIRKRTPI